MKKLITTFAFIALSTVSAKAIDMEMFSITGGLAANQGQFLELQLKRQDDYNDSWNDQLKHTDKESRCFFRKSFGSQFVELGIGRFISLGL